MLDLKNELRSGFDYVYRISALLQCPSTFLSSWHPWYTFAFVMEPPLTKIKKHELLVRKSNISLLDTSTNKQFLQEFKSKTFNDPVVLGFLECTCYIQNLAKRSRNSNSCRPICLTLAIELHLVRFGLGASYIWTILLIAVHTFAIFIISLHIGKYAVIASTGFTK